MVAAEADRDSPVAGVAGLNLKGLRLQEERVIALRKMVRMIEATLWLSFRGFVRKSRVEKLVRMRCVLRCNAWEVAEVDAVSSGPTKGPVVETVQVPPPVIRDLQSSS